MANRRPQTNLEKEPSPGMKRVRAEWAALIKDTSLSEADFIEALFRSLREHASEMAEDEIAGFQSGVTSLMYDFEKALAARGMPRPGNNPKKPN